MAAKLCSFAEAAADTDDMGEGGNRGRGNASEGRQDKEDPRWRGGR